MLLGCFYTLGYLILCLILLLTLGLILLPIQIRDGFGGNSTINNKIGGGQIQIIGGQNASSLVFMLLGALYPPTVLPPHTRERSA